MRAKLVSNPEDWKYSSYSHYVGVAKYDFLKAEPVLDQFLTKKDYDMYVAGYSKVDWKYVVDLLFR